MRVADVLFSLIRFEITGEELSEEIKSSIDSVILLDLYKLSKDHDVAHLVENALSKIGVALYDDILKDYKKQKMLAIYRSEILESHLQRIKEALRKAKIPFVPLKGAVIKKHYPERWMRTSCDIDILVHEDDLEKAIDALKEDFWSVVGKKNYHDISLYSKNGVHLELHFSIKENIKTIDSVLEKVWKYTSLKQGTECEFVLTNEFLLFHLLAHISYHFVKGGCGVRTILDLWILMNKLEYDKSRLRQICAQAKIDVFYDNILSLIDVWFNKKQHSIVTQKMEDFILSGGVYGTDQNRIKVSQAKDGGKGSGILKRIFMPYGSLKIRYPVLERYKFLTPLFQIARWIDLAFKGRFRRLVKEYRIGDSIPQDEVNNTESLFKEIGLM
ncbi:MAG: nucleotidyltransferase family protein [Clostridia bacterium]|nr:nucleotidyltransferase family protein [Clostridia bacterium]MBQ9737805.1 nucleotidyltransferase family protein [Clostridia bacterium]